MTNEAKILIDEDMIRAQISRSAARVSEQYRGKPLLLVSVLKGAFIFMSDYCRSLDIPCEIAFMAAESYGASTSSSGEVNIKLDIAQDISGYHVIILEDIIDTGNTLKKICDILRARAPLSLRVITLLDKPSRRCVDMKADESLFTIPDLFVVGYGLDYAEKYRNLRYIGIL